MGLTFFLEVINTAAYENFRDLRVLDVLGQGPDHPSLNRHAGNEISESCNSSSALELDFHHKFPRCFFHNNYGRGYTICVRDGIIDLSYSQ